MKKAWSISTTVRNPDRILPFLTTLQEMDGEEFDEAGQIKFQTLLIKNKLYKPTGLSQEMLAYYENESSTIPFNIAETIFSHMRSRSRELQNDPGLRGRTSAAPLTKMGLAIAASSEGAVKISSIGKAFINGSLDIGDVYFRFFLKWQIPTPGSNDFSDESVYDLKPFIGILHLISKVNTLAASEEMAVKGISKAEFAIFGQTLINSADIESYAHKIIEFRKLQTGKSRQEINQIISQYGKRFASQFFDEQDSSRIDTLYGNLRDYADNSIRYFRLTRYVYIRGGGFYIDLEPRRRTEISELLSMDPSSSSFESDSDYIKYLSDIKQPPLPWETKDKLEEIVREIKEDVSSIELNVNYSEDVIPENVSQLEETDLKELVTKARTYRRKLQELENHQASSNIEAIEEYIEKLSNIFTLENRPVQLEKYSTLALHALNDAVRIQPNYPVGDDNEPTFTAPANVPDIECFYDQANSICEVTMLTSRDQWINEGQPVMRHLRDFEDKYASKPAYCVFVAPSLHRDTINTYWPSVKLGYEGVKQKIIPLTISDLVVILETLIRLKRSGRTFEHTKLFELYDLIVLKTDEVSSSVEWQASIPSIIGDWSQDLVAA